ncbi:MAG: histidine kinase dimerization/phosphoacceptor domain -containing protein [Bacteroidia bacterium]
MRFSLLFVFVLICFLLPAQTPLVDSLKEVLSKAKTAPERAEALILLSNKYQGFDLDEARKYGRKAVALCGQEGLDSLKGYALIGLGRGYANGGLLDSAGMLFLQSHRIFTRLNDTMGMARALQKREYVFQYKSNYDSAVWAALEALKLYESLGRISEAGAMNRTLGELFYSKNEPENGLEKGLAALEIHMELGDEINIALDHESIAYNYILLEDFEKALFHEKKANEIFAKDPDNIDLAIGYNNLGNIYKRKGDLDSALIAYNKALKHPMVPQYPGLLQPIYGNLAEIHLLKKEYQKALPILIKSDSLMAASGYSNNLVEGYLHLSEAYEGLLDYKAALSAYKQYHYANDSLLSLEKNKFMSELNEKYETDKKEAQIDLLHEKRRADRNRFILVAIGLGLLALLAVFLFRINQQRKKANLLLSEKNRENELLLKEIHHRVKNNLQVISSLLRLQSAHIQDAGVKEAVKAGEHRVKSMALIHQKLYQHEDLSAVEMKDYLQTLCKSLKSTFGKKASGIAFEYAMEPLLLDVDTAVPLGLIVNELVTNSLKYAFAPGEEGTVTIGLGQESEEQLVLKVSDNGSGAEDSPEQEGSTSFGSKLVQLLTTQLEGSLEVERSPSYSYVLKLRKFKLAGS